MQTQGFFYRGSANCLRPCSKCDNLETPLNDQELMLDRPLQIGVPS